MPPTKIARTKPSREAARAGTRFCDRSPPASKADHTAPWSNSTSGRSRTPSSPQAKHSPSPDPDPAASPGAAGPSPDPARPAHNGAPRAPATRPRARRAARSAHKGGRAGPGTRQVLLRASRAARGRGRGPGPAGLGALTFSMVPGSRRSSSRQRTTPSFSDACKKPSGSEMVFLGDSSTPRVMSHVTVCSAEFIAAAARAGRREGARARRSPRSGGPARGRPRPRRLRAHGALGAGDWLGRPSRSGSAPLAPRALARCQVPFH